MIVNFAGSSGTSTEVTELDIHKAFMTLLSNTPIGFEMWMGMSTNYLQLKTIYTQRRLHKTDDWREFCKWIETLPMFLELTRKQSRRKDEINGCTYLFEKKRTSTYNQSIN